MIKWEQLNQTNWLWVDGRYGLAMSIHRDIKRVTDHTAGIDIPQNWIFA